MFRRRKISGKDAVGWLLIGISVLMLGKSIALCFSQDIWYDELFTVGMIEHSYGELIHFTAADVHPPLYYCVTKFFVDLCKLIIPGAGTVIPAKLVSVLPYFVLLLYSVTFIRKRFGIFTGGMFLFCVIAMPQMSAYTVEVRMYGWALLFVTAAFLHAYGCVTAAEAENVGQVANIAMDSGVKERCLHAGGLVLYGLAAAYTQYFACVAVVMVYLYVLAAFWCLDRRRMKEWVLYVAVSVVGYIPWLFALMGQISAVQENYWILPLTWRSLGGCVKFLMKPACTNERLNVVLAVILSAGYAAVVVGSLVKEIRGVGYRRDKGNWRDKADRTEHKIGENNKKVYYNGRVLHAIAGLCVLIGVVLFGFAASILIRPVFVYRYMIPAMGTFWLCFAICLGDILCKLRTDLDMGYGAQKESEPKLRQNTQWNMNRKTQQNTDQKIQQNIDCKGQQNIDQEVQQKTDHEAQQDIRQKVKQRNIAITVRNGNRSLRFMQGIVMALTFLLVVIGLRDYRAFLGEEEYKILLMKDTEKALSEIAPDDIVIYNFDQVQAVTSYYLGNTTERYLWNVTAEKLIQEIVGPCETVEDEETIRQWLVRSEETAGVPKRHVWFIGSFNSREDIVAQWRKSGLTVVEKGSYLLERYWFNLYEIDLQK